MKTNEEIIENALKKTMKKQERKQIWVTMQLYSRLQKARMIGDEPMPSVIRRAMDCLEKTMKKQ